MDPCWADAAFVFATPRGNHGVLIEVTFSAQSLRRAMSMPIVDQTHLRAWLERSGKHGALGQARHAASNRSDLQQGGSFAGALARLPLRGRPGCLHGPWLMDSPRGV